MVKNREINGTEEIALVTPTPGRPHIRSETHFSCPKTPPTHLVTLTSGTVAKPGSILLAHKARTTIFTIGILDIFQPVYKVFTQHKRGEPIQYICYKKE